MLELPLIFSCPFGNVSTGEMEGGLIRPHTGACAFTGIYGNLPRQNQLCITPEGLNLF